MPREVGAWMAVTGAGITGTVGGGHLEFDAIARARAALDGGMLEEEVRYPLGPGLGQCCGGVVWLRFESIAAGEELQTRLPVEPLRPLAVFGAGHVGRAVARITRDLPLALHWIDSREDQFPDEPPAPNWCLEAVDPIADAVPELASGSAVLIMSYSHAEDFNLVAACLKRQRERNDLAFLGLIGSRSKWASFRHRLAARGYGEADLTRVVCPIGVAGVAGKQPAVIAVAVLAQILALPAASAASAASVSR